MNTTLTYAPARDLQDALAAAETCAACVTPSCVSLCPQHADPRRAIQYLISLAQPALVRASAVQEAESFVVQAITDSFE